MAPEACRGEDVDHRVDIYSVGVLMYLLFTGQVPFHDENFLKLLQMQVLAAPIPPRELDPGVSEAIEAVILRAMSKDPDERYLSVDHLLRDFEQALPEGANEWLAETSRVSMPVPVVTGSNSSGSMPAYRTPIPGLKSPVAVHSVITGSSKQIAAIPQAPTRSRAPIAIALLFLLAAGGGAAWYFTRDGAHDNAVAATGEPAAHQDPTPPRPAPAPTTTATDPPTPPAKTQVHLRITTRPAHALIRLGDITLGRTPLDQTVEAQTDARLEVSADGYKSEVRKLALDSDQTLEIALDRVRVVEAPRPPPPQPHRPPVAKNIGSGSSTPPAPPPGELEIRDHR
jgi:serine/threonine-protein kinase